MADRERRQRAVQQILSEISRGTDRGDHVAAMIHIQAARRRGEITSRDVERLITFLTAIHGDRLVEYIH